MSQPVSTNQYIRISGTAAGSTVIGSIPTNLVSVTSGGNYTGTITFYDAATAAGTTAGNQILQINNNSGSIPFTITPDIRTKTGLIAQVGGTTDITVGYDF